MVSHEIRTPLNAVHGATAMLMETLPLTKEQGELLALLDAGANHVVLIVEDSACPVCTLLLTRTSHSLTRRAAHPQSCCTAR